MAVENKGKASHPLLLLVLLLASLVFAQTARAAKIKEWRLEQKHYLSGDHVIYLTPISIRVFNNQIGYQVVSKAPDWKVYAFRDDDKVMREMTRPEFYENQEYHPINDGTGNGKLTKIGTQSVGGTKVEVFRFGADEKWLGHLPGIPKAAHDLILAYYKLRPAEGLLMKYSTDGVNAEEKGSSFLASEYKGRLTVVETLRINEVPYNPADFKVPTGYKKVVAIEQIMTSADRRKEADSVFEELGLGEKLGKKKSK